MAKVTKNYEATPEENVINAAAGTWKTIKGDSVEYVRKMRAEYEKRAKRLGI